MLKAKSPASVAELIIATQSVILALVGAAGWMAVKPVHDGFVAIRDKDSMVAIATDNGITTDKVTIDLKQVEQIIINYEGVCIVAMILGLSVATATIVRIFIKHNAKNNSTRPPADSVSKRRASPRGKGSR